MARFQTAGWFGDHRGPATLRKLVFVLAGIGLLGQLFNPQTGYVAWGLNILGSVIAGAVLAWIAYLVTRWMHPALAGALVYAGFIGFAMLFVLPLLLTQRRRITPLAEVSSRPAPERPAESSAAVAPGGIAKNRILSAPDLAKLRGEAEVVGTHLNIVLHNGTDLFLDPRGMTVAVRYEGEDTDRLYDLKLASDADYEALINNRGSQAPRSAQRFTVDLGLDPRGRKVQWRLAQAMTR